MLTNNCILYTQDVELRCNFVMASFVKKTLKKAHGTLVDRLCQKTASASKSPSPNLSPSGSVNAHSATEKSDLHAVDAAYLTGRPRNGFSAGQAYSQPLYAQPNSRGSTPTAPYGYTPYRKPVPPPSPPRYNDPVNGWAGGQPQQAPAELQ